MSSVREFELSTGNLLMGRFTFVVVSVPEGWAVKIGDAPADVNYTTIVDGVGWVLDGSSYYYVVNLVTGEVIDLEVHVKKGLRQKSHGNENAAVIYVNGHTAILETRQVKRGLPRKPATKITLTIPCQKTSRTIELVFTGKSGEELEELRKCFPSIRCH
ncbi:MAG: hypothetical protein QXN23_03165 [Candidatus Caldarchaeum sp.]|uniref:Uncharacterized protein n=1 Tax=Caldiarchaeum subterraneum TaxID=311458 RepID=A0A7C4E035_CALS0|nr:hypothetical protein [Candidatus Caldarchaeales archaeon]